MTHSLGPSSRVDSAGLPRIHRPEEMKTHRTWWIIGACIWILCLNWCRGEGTVQIQPFHFPTSVKEGQKVQVICGLLQGEGQIYFQWRKNGEIIDQNDDVSIVQHAEFSRLAMNNVDVKNTGNYSCTAKNRYGEDTYTAHLGVRGPPKWLKEPLDTSTSLGDTVTLTCATYGYPPPDVTWKVANESSPDHWSPVSNGQHVRLESNGSLTITNIQHSHSGLYQCLVSNGMGQILQKIVAISIKVPARFATKFAKETVRWGETAILHCEAFGDNPISITWTKDRIPITEKESSRYEVFGSLTDQSTVSELHVQVAERDDNGLYVCIAKNAFGKDERSVKLVVLEVPGPPSDVRVEQTWSQSASVRWTNPYGGNSPITSFVVQYWRDAGAPHRLEESPVLATQTFTMLKGLQPGTSYIIRVLAENDVGRGNPSESQQFVTKEAEPSAPPTDVTVESRGSETLLVKWKAPPKDQWNGQLKGYYIGYLVSGSSEPYSFRTVEFSKQGDDGYKLTGLQRSTEYKVIVQAFNGAGSGPASQDIAATTTDKDPPLPPFLWVDFQSRSTIGLKWKSAPALLLVAPEESSASTENPTATPMHYTLYFKDEFSPWSEVTIPKSAESTYTLSGLREGTRYQLYLRTASEAGESDPSDILTVRTEGGALSDMSSHPVDEKNEDLPIYLKSTVIVPLGTSVGIVLVVLFGACLYVGREEKRNKARAAGGPARHYSYSGSSTLPHPGSKRCADLEKGRPLIKGMPLPPQPPPEGYPLPYATMPLRFSSNTVDTRRKAKEVPVMSRNGILHHATMDRKRMAGLTIHETAEVHHYDMAA